MDSNAWYKLKTVTLILDIPNIHHVLLNSTGNNLLLHGIPFHLEYSALEWKGVIASLLGKSRPIANAVMLCIPNLYSPIFASRRQVVSRQAPVQTLDLPMKENHRAHLFCVPLKLLPRRFINSQIGVHKEGYKKECEENRQKHHMFSHRINEIRPRQMYGSLVTSGDSSARTADSLIISHRQTTTRTAMKISTE